MALRSDAAFDTGLDFFGDVITRLGPDDWALASPCEGWSTLDVLGHLGSSIDFGISILQGQQPTWPDASKPGELVEGEPAAYWSRIAERARAALVGADLDMVMDTPMGPRSVADRLAFPAIDLYVHGWDIARAVGLDVVIPDDIIEFAHGYIDPLPQDKVRGGEGAFGPAAELPSDATPTEAFIAWTGRPPR